MTKPSGPANCTHVLRANGVPYPRTCARCGLGPCPFNTPEPSAPSGKEREGLEVSPGQDQPSARLRVANPSGEPQTAEAAVSAGPGYQARVGLWMTAAFGPLIPWDLNERNFRFAEEAMGLCQANGATAEEMHTIVDYVFRRPVGEREQEVGGVSVTLAALCNACGIDQEAEALRELERIERPEIMAKIRAKQAAKPEGVRAPLPGFVPAPSPHGEG